MRFGYHTNTWGGVVGHPAGVTSIKDLFYLTNGSNEAALADIHEAGYEGVELFDGNLYEYRETPSILEGLLKKYQLQLIAVYSGANFIYEDILDDEFWRIEEAAKIGQRLGAEHLVVGGGAIRATGPRMQDYSVLARSLDRVNRLAKSYGLRASYHPHLGTITQDSEGIDRVFAMTEIDFCPDTAHLVAGGSDLLTITKKYKDRMKYIHLKDYGHQRFLPLGHGQLPIHDMVTMLQVNGFDGWITVELDYFDGAPKDAAVMSREYCKRL